MEDLLAIASHPRLSHIAVRGSLHWGGEGRRPPTLDFNSDGALKDAGDFPSLSIASAHARLALLRYVVEEEKVATALSPGALRNVEDAIRALKADTAAWGGTEPPLVRKKSWRADDWALGASHPPSSLYGSDRSHRMRGGSSLGGGLGQGRRKAAPARHTFAQLAAQMHDSTWECSTCETRNPLAAIVCASCVTAKPGAAAVLSWPAQAIAGSAPPQGPSAAGEITSQGFTWTPPAAGAVTRSGFPWRPSTGRVSSAIH